MSSRRHGRFYVAILAGLLVFLLSGGAGSRSLRLVLAGDVFFLSYLLMTAAYLVRATSEHLRRSAAEADEGLALILLATGATVIVSLGAIWLLITQKSTGLGAGALAIAGIPLGWLTLHTMASFHYATLFYAPRGAPEGAPGGLDFPGTAAPGPWDFLYFAFVVGMTAQVSDVAVRTSALRRTVLAHGVAAFFYNTVIVALAVNAALAFAGR